MAPEGFKRLTVADICEMQNGHGFGPEDWTSEGLPIIRIQNLNGGRNFDYYAGPTDPRWLVEPGQLLFAWAGTKGVSFGPTIWRSERGVLNQHIFKVNAKPGIDGSWLYWALRYVTDRIEAKAHGFKSTLVHVKKSDIDRQVILVPERRRQRRVAETLMAWDQAIETTQRVIENSQEYRRALADALLTGQRRLRSSGEWRRRRLADLIVESRIPGTSGDSAQKITVKLYGRGVVAKNEKRLGSDATQYYRRSAGQFIYSKLDFLNGAFGLVPTELDGFESTLDLPAFDIGPGIHPRWLLHFVSRPGFYRSHLGLANGGRKARRVNPSDLLRIEIDVPSIEEQELIAGALDVAFADELAWQDEQRLLEQQRRALTHELLSGRRDQRAASALA